MIKNRVIYLAYSFSALILGCLIYVGESISLNQPAIIRNHLPDGLWATSFAASICCIWHNNLTYCYIWIGIAIVIMISFEVLQYLGAIRGTGDPLDVIVYLMFSLPPLVAVSKQTKTQNGKNEKYKK